jgi:DNA-binding NtrC family response regulator
MTEVLALAKRFARSDANLLLTGESGTGKEVVARLVHEASRRASGPFVAINCAAIPEALLEAELFGHAKGAFTGAVNARAGRFEAASGGTLLLDEISEMEPRLQAKLLRVLQERQVDPLGAQRGVPVDTRVIATSNRDLFHEVKTGRFRQDLFFRLAVVELKLPPLRERREDLALLAAHFAQKFVELNQLPPKSVGAAALSRLQRHDWPGNVRELENCLHRAVLLCDGPVIEPEHLSITAGPSRLDSESSSSRSRVGQSLASVERDFILETLAHVGGNRTRAATLLGISVRTLRNKLSEYGPVAAAGSADPRALSLVAH